MPLAALLPGRSLLVAGPASMAGRVRSAADYNGQYEGWKGMAVSYMKATLTAASSLLGYDNTDYAKIGAHLVSNSRNDIENFRQELYL
jgi:hypothetical protein